MSETRLALTDEWRTRSREILRSLEPLRWSERGACNDADDIDAWWPERGSKNVHVLAGVRLGEVPAGSAIHRRAIGLGRQLGHPEPDVEAAA